MELDFWTVEWAQVGEILNRSTIPRQQLFLCEKGCKVRGFEG